MQLIGFAFGYPTEFEIKQFGMLDEIRWCRLEIGDRTRLSNGRELGPLYWRKWELAPKESRTMAKKVLKEAEVHGEISGFTLFWNGAHIDGKGNKVEPGFQMSIRQKGQVGWSIRRISEEQANLLFAHLEYVPGPQGPWMLTDGIKSDLRDSFIVPQMAVDATKGPQPKRADLFALLAVTERLVGRLNDFLATQVAEEV